MPSEEELDEAAERLEKTLGSNEPVEDGSEG